MMDASLEQATEIYAAARCAEVGERSSRGPAKSIGVRAGGRRRRRGSLAECGGVSRPAPLPIAKRRRKEKDMSNSNVRDCGKGASVDAACATVDQLGRAAAPWRHCRLLAKLERSRAGLLPTPMMAVVAAVAAPAPVMAVVAVMASPAPMMAVMASPPPMVAVTTMVAMMAPAVLRHRRSGREYKADGGNHRQRLTHHHLSSMLEPCLFVSSRAENNRPECDILTATRCDDTTQMQPEEARDGSRQGLNPGSHAARSGSGST